MIVKLYVSCCGGDKAIATIDEAVKQSGVEAQVEIVKDMAQMARAGVMSTPAIQINDKLVVAGRLPKVPDLVTMLVNAAATQA